jgi:ABC-2 type transport system ATP-binding protein
MEALAGVHDLEAEDHRVRCQVDTDHLGEVLVHLHSLGIVDVTVQPPTLEELFMRHYQSDGRAAVAR